MPGKQKAKLANYWEISEARCCVSADEQKQIGKPRAVLKWVGNTEYIFSRSVIPLQLKGLTAERQMCI